MGGLGLGLIGGLSWGLIGGLMGGLVAGMAVWSKDFGLIEPAEKLEWSWQRVRAMLIPGLLLGLSGLMNGLIGGLSSGPIVGLSLGLIGGLSAGLFVWLGSGLRATKIEITTLPNQGIWNSAKNAVVITLIGGLSGGLFLGLIVGLVIGLSGGLSGGLIFGLLYGGQAVIQHYTLRFLLSRAGCFPWNLVCFLDYAAERVFLRKVGGGYIFVHRTLMEHFASLNPPQVKP